MTATIQNLTPHTVTLRDSAGAVAAEFPPGGAIARVVVEIATAAPIGTVRATHTYPRSIDGLPVYAPGVYYVVSQVTADAADALGRRTDDLLIPGQQTRDDAGRVNGCGSLVRYQPMRARLSSPWEYAARHLAHAAEFAAAVEWGETIEVPVARAGDALGQIWRRVADPSAAADNLSAEDLSALAAVLERQAEEYGARADAATGDAALMERGAAAAAQRLARKLARMAQAARV